MLEFEVEVDRDSNIGVFEFGWLLVGTFMKKFRYRATDPADEFILVWKKDDRFKYYKLTLLDPFIEDSEDENQILPSLHIRFIPALQLDTREVFFIDSFSENSWDPILVFHISLFEDLSIVYRKGMTNLYSISNSIRVSTLDGSSIIQIMSPDAVPFTFLGRMKFPDDVLVVSRWQSDGIFVQLFQLEFDYYKFRHALATGFQKQLESCLCHPEFKKVFCQFLIACCTSSIVEVFCSFAFH